MDVIDNERLFINWWYRSRKCLHVGHPDGSQRSPHRQSLEILVHRSKYMEQILGIQILATNPGYEVLRHRHRMFSDSTQANRCITREDNRPWRKQTSGRIVQSYVVCAVLCDTDVIVILEIYGVVKRHPRDVPIFPKSIDFLVWSVPTLHPSAPLYALHVPVGGRSPKPLDPGVLHGGSWIEALSDGMGDNGIALLLEQFDESFLFRHEGVDLCRLSVEKPGDGALFVRIAENYSPGIRVPSVQAGNCGVPSSGVQPQVGEQVVQPADVGFGIPSVHMERRIDGEHVMWAIVYLAKGPLSTNHEAWAKRVLAFVRANCAIRAVHRDISVCSIFTGKGVPILELANSLQTRHSPMRRNLVQRVDLGILVSGIGTKSCDACQVTFTWSAGGGTRGHRFSHRYRPAYRDRQGPPGGQLMSNGASVSTLPRIGARKVTTRSPTASNASGGGTRGSVEVRYSPQRRIRRSSE